MRLGRHRGRMKQQSAASVWGPCRHERAACMHGGDSRRYVLGGGGIGPCTHGHDRGSAAGPPRGAGERRRRVAAKAEAGRRVNARRVNTAGGAHSRVWLSGCVQIGSRQGHRRTAGRRQCRPPLRYRHLLLGKTGQQQHATPVQRGDQTPLRVPGAESGTQHPPRPSSARFICRCHLACGGIDAQAESSPCGGLAEAFRRRSPCARGLRLAAGGHVRVPSEECVCSARSPPATCDTGDEALLSNLCRGDGTPVAKRRGGGAAGEEMTGIDE
mmetsp:Transcript_1119/g.3694  ORF Transcript_1119/g.3694 Transcript_1119/m.3694 type:complete len:271 (+) Transcript_1119:80-892(+)|eukprot:scaffold31931_cov112-Isochrysis_galbana.AAC.4